MNTQAARMMRTLAVVALCGAAAPAVGQYALDRNLQRGAGRVNQARPDFAAELRFRNAIVTGNAPGGLSFRGGVGYTAPGEFFGQLGSNENFAFRRDAVYSGLGGVGIRGTDALQYQFAMTTGNAPPPGGYGLPIVRRSGTGSTAALVGTETPYRSNIASVTPGREVPGADAGDFGRVFTEMLPMRSPSAFVSNRGLQPTLLGTVQDPEGQTGRLTASGLRGISYTWERAEPAIGGELPTGLEPREIQQGTGRETGREGQTGPQGRQNLRENQQVGTGLSERPLRVDTRVGREVDLRRSPYDDVLERMRVSREATLRPEEGTEQPAATTWEQRLEELRQQLAERQPGQPTGLPPQPGTPEAQGKEGEQPIPQREFRPETIEMLRHGGNIETLAPSGFDAYSTAMKMGQEFLANERYFDAEARFTAALSAKPGDPMAAAGRIHSALGAGMFLSAALNLRTLLTDNPELAGVKYSANLLPSRERLSAVKTRLGELLTEVKDGDAELGLLLAYVGWQTADSAAVERGLNAMQGQDVQESVARLGNLLRRVWAGGAQPSK